MRAARFTCHFCGQTRSTPEALAAHILQIHARWRSLWRKVK